MIPKRWFSLNCVASKTTGILCGLALFGVLVTSVGCSGDSTEELVVYSSRTSSLVQPLLERYATESGHNVQVRYATTASIIATLLEEGKNAQADVVYLAEPSGWGLLSEAGMLSELPDDVLNKVAPHFRSSVGQWVGTSGRSKVVVYNTATIDPERDIPDSVLDFTDSKWKGRFGWAPMHGEWQISLMAIRLLEGDEVARKWLEDIKANDPKVYPNLISIVHGAHKGEIDVGLVNHYYVPRFISKEGDDYGARNHFVGGGDPGAVIDVAGVGIVEGTGAANAARDFVDFMLGVEAQKYFAEKTFEYPVSSGVKPVGDLPSLESLNPPHIDPADLSELESTLEMLRDADLIP